MLRSPVADRMSVMIDRDLARLQQAVTPRLGTEPLAEPTVIVSVKG